MVERFIELVTALLVAIVSAVVTLRVERLRHEREKAKAEVEARLEEERNESDELLDFSNAAKLQGETWTEIVTNLRTEVGRIKRDSEKREKNFLNEIESLKSDLKDNRFKLENVMESERKKSMELETKLKTVTNENFELRAKIVAVEGENFKLRTELEDTRKEVNELRAENEQLREQFQNAIHRVDQKVDSFQRKVTGELKLKGGEN